MEPKAITIPQMTTEELVEYVKQSVKDMHSMLREQRKKLGAKYYMRNPYEQLASRFGEDPQKLIDEYNLILEKKSNQPASVREPIKFVVGRALDLLLSAKAREAIKAEQEAKKAKEEKKEEQPKKKRKTTTKKTKTKT